MATSGNHINTFERVIATREITNCTEDWNQMWIEKETKSFSKDTPVSEIMEWGRNAKGGSLVLTIDEHGASRGPIYDFH